MLMTPTWRLDQYKLERILHYELSQHLLELEKLEVPTPKNPKNELFGVSARKQFMLSIVDSAKKQGFLVDRRYNRICDLFIFYTVKDKVEEIIEKVANLSCYGRYDIWK